MALFRNTMKPVEKVLRDSRYNVENQQVMMTTPINNNLNSKLNVEIYDNYSNNNPIDNPNIEVDTTGHIISDKGSCVGRKWMKRYQRLPRLVKKR